MLIKLLFPTKPDATGTSLLLLATRIIFGILLMSHGIQKMFAFHELSTTFPDPIGLGSNVSLTLAIFAELLCSLAFIFGILYRLAIIPMIFTMFVAFTIIHGGDPFAQRELPFAYMMVFGIMWIAGPGKYSIDWLIGKKISQKTRASHP